MSTSQVTVVVGLALGVLMQVPASAQTSFEASSVLVRGGGGFAVSEHDLDQHSNVGPVQVEFYALQASASVPVGSFRLGAGYIRGSYSDVRVANHTSVLHTVRAYVGRRLGSSFIRPYVTAGPSLVLGGSQVGLGLSGSGGIELSVAPRYALFVEANGSLVTPDRAVDGQSGGRSPLDLVGVLTTGVTTSLP